MASFEGSWKQVESDRFDEFLSAFGIGWMKRKMMTSSNPTIQIQVSGENLTISYTGEITFFSSEKSNFWSVVGVISGSHSYKIGGTVKMKNYMQEEVDADCIIEDEEKIVIIMKGGSLGDVRITRVVEDGKLHVEHVSAYIQALF